MQWISRFYILFVGILLTLTAGFGIAAFNPEPASPPYPTYSPSVIVPQPCYQETARSPECQRYLDQQEQERLTEIETMKKYKEDQRVFKNKNASYTRTSIFFGVAAGALFVIPGILMIKKSKLVANGLLFAGMLTGVLTRLIIKFASLGASVTGTETASNIAFVEFGILVILSIGVIFIGLYSLKEDASQSTP